MASNVSDVGGKLIAWILAGTGSLLLYSAYKNRAPLDVLRNTMGNPISVSSIASGALVGSSTGSYSGSIPRLRQIANREIPPTLVSLSSGGRLDKDAAASFERVNLKMRQETGVFQIKHVGAYRTYAEQASLYASNPARFAPPNKSLHVVGLAIDIHASQVDNPKLIAAFTAEGWHRARLNDEPWHWSYGVSG